jgi:hypothetical protein
LEKIPAIEARERSGIKSTGSRSGTLQGRRTTQTGNKAGDFLTTTFSPMRATEIRSAGFIAQAKHSELAGSEGALDRLISRLLRAFFIAMAVTWIVTTIADIFR